MTDHNATSGEEIPITDGQRETATDIIESAEADDQESAVLTTERRVQSPHFELVVEPDGVVKVYRAGSIEGEMPVASFDASQIYGPEVREQALDVIEPRLRWAKYIRLYDESPEAAPLITYDLSDDLDQNVPLEYQLPSPRKLSQEQPTLSEKFDLEFGTGLEREMFDELKTLSAGDLVRFGGGIEPHIVHGTYKDRNLIWVHFYGEDADAPKDDPAQLLQVSYPDEETNYKPSRQIFAWSYGPDEEQTVTGILTGAEVSEYDGDEYDADRVADVTWKVNPTGDS